MASYKPLNEDYMAKIGFRYLAVSTVLLPLGAFALCVFWSLWFDFRGSTATHCGVSNYLPSISAAIGATDAQNYIWRTSIALHCGPRFLVVKMYNDLYNRIIVPTPRNYVITKMCCTLNLIENFALLGLTYVSSRDNYPIHEKCFITFMAASELYMILTIVLMRSTQDRFMDSKTIRSLTTKTQLLTINITAFGLAAYFFYRHNWYCETGVYTLFALSEYIVVFTNMGYHMTAYYDFYDKFIYVGPEYLIKTS